MTRYIFFKSALAHYVTDLSRRCAGSSLRIVVVLGIIALPYIFPLPFFNSLTVNLGQRYISTNGYKIVFTHPSPDSDYVIRQSLADYDAYVLGHSDLYAAYQNDSKGLSISDWGRAHYIEFGKAEGRYLSGRDADALVVRKRTQPSESTLPIDFRVRADSSTIRIDNDSDQQRIGFGQICFSAFYNSLCWEQDQNAVGSRKNTLVNQNFGLRIKNAYRLNELSLPVPNEQSDLVFERQGNDPYLLLSSQVVTISQDHLLQLVSSSLLLTLWPIAILFISFLTTFFYQQLLRRHLTHKGYKFVSRHIPICVLIVFCMAVSLRGIDYGDHFDEGGYIDTAKQMLDQVGSGGPLLPHWYGFPSLLFYLALLPIAPEAITKNISSSQQISNHGDSTLSKLADQRMGIGGLKRYQYILKTRYISLLCYGISIILIYLIVLRMAGNWREAFSASAFFGLSWEAAYHFRMFTPDPIMVPFVLLTLYFLVSAQYKNDWDHYLRWASICAGIACGAKYTAIFLTLSIVFASLYLHLRSKYQTHQQQTEDAASLNSRHRSTQIDYELGVRSFLGLGLRLICWFLLAYFLTTPGTLLEPVKFLSDVTTQEWVYREAGGGGYSVWLLFDKLQITGTYLSAVFFSQYVWISIILSTFFLFGLCQITRETYAAILFLPYLVAVLFILLSYNIIYLRNFLSLFPFFAIIAARGFISSHTWILSSVSLSSRKLTQLITGAYILFFVLVISLNSYWLWVSTESIQLAQPTNSDRKVCEETYKFERPTLSSCNAYPNEDFADKQITQLINYMSKSPNTSFVLSNMVRAELLLRNLSPPSNVQSSYDVSSLAVYYSREPFLQPKGTPWQKSVHSTHLDSMGANRFNHYQLLPSGPHDVNFTYYPTWPGPNRIVIAPLKETFEEAGTIFSLED